MPDDVPQNAPRRAECHGRDAHHGDLRVDQDVLAPNANVATRSWESILADLYAVREATLRELERLGNVGT